MTAKEQQRKSRVVWFEIPALDFERACRFYQGLLSTNLIRGTFGPHRMAVFPYEDPAISGCLMEADGYKPGATGGLIYLNADPNLDEVLARVEQHGGNILVPRTALPDGMGFFARIQDTEGNAIGLHAIS